MPKVKIEVSARHAHLTQQDLEKLFGDGYQLEKEKKLSQEGEFASSAKVKLVGLKGEIDNVRVVGPCRIHTQVEVSRTDAFKLGCPAPLRLSGKIIRSGAIKLVGTKGELELTEGLIVAKRHIHLSNDQASQFCLNNGQIVRVFVDGPRTLTFGEVEVRVNEKFDASFHIDTDEANAAGIDSKMQGEIIV